MSVATVGGLATKIGMLRMSENAAGPSAPRERVQFPEVTFVEENDAEDEFADEGATGAFVRNSSTPRPPCDERERNMLDMCKYEGYAVGPDAAEDKQRMLFSHQYENIERFRSEISQRLPLEAGARAEEDRPPYGVLIGDVPGLGKTTSASVCLGLARFFAKSIYPDEADQYRCSVLIGPKNVLPQWEDEIRLLYPEWRVVRFSGGRKDFDTDTTDLVITTAETLVSQFKRCYKNEFKDGKIPSPDPSGDPEETGWRRKADEPLLQFFSAKFSAFVADEGHALRNGARLKYHAAFAVARRAVARVILTGTPFNNYSRELANQIRLVRGRPEYKKSTTLTGMVSAETIDKLHRTTLIRHPKSILNLPRLSSKILRVTMWNDERDVLRNAAAMLQAAVRAGGRVDWGSTKNGILRALTGVRKASISKHMYIEYEEDAGVEEAEDGSGEESDGEEGEGSARGKRKKRSDARSSETPTKAQMIARQERIAARIVVEPSSKIVLAVQTILRLVREERRKVVVFCSFVPPLRAIQKFVEGELGADSAPLLWSGLSDGDRLALLRAPRPGIPGGRFHADDACKVLLSTFSSGGVGLNLAPAASAVVMIDVWWNPSVLCFRRRIACTASAPYKSASSTSSQTPARSIRPASSSTTRSRSATETPSSTARTSSAARCTSRRAPRRRS